jgi:tRNA threonylcarbamoyladenosine biosynthesis protein TsaB
MLVLALDTTTRPGSHALVRAGEVLAMATGDGTRAHAERLPGELLALLNRSHYRLDDVDLLAVAAGPGSFTGLRIGIASMQGLAFAANRPVIGVSALDALARCASGRPGDYAWIGVWMDGQRGEVFAARYARPASGPLVVAAPPTVGSPASVLAQWQALGPGPGLFVGDGAVRYEDVIAESRLATAVVDPTPATAAAIAALAVERHAAGGTFHPHAIVPVYVRKSDAELARDRRTATHA